MEDGTTKLIELMIPMLQTVFAEAGWGGALGVALMFLVRIFRLDIVQRAVVHYYPKAAWANLNPWVKWGTTFGLAFLGALVWKFTAGLGWAAAIGAAISLAVGQLGAHWATKKAGQVAASAGPLGDLMRGTDLKVKIPAGMQAPALESVPAPEPPPKP